MIATLILAGLVWTSALGPIQRAERPGTVTGQILSSSGAPAAGVRVGLMDAADFSDSNVMGFTQTDADGRYRLDNVTPGRYYIFAGTLDLPTYYPGDTQLSRATMITVRAGSDSGNTNFSLARLTEGFKVSGRLVLHMEKPPAKINGAAFLMLPSFSDVGGSATLSEDGSFAISGVRPGVYMLQVILGDFPANNFLGQFAFPDDVCVENFTICGGGPPGRPPAQPIAEARPITVMVRDKDIVGLEPLIPRHVEIRGIAVTEGGEALPDFALKFVDRGGANMSLQGTGSSTSVTFGEPQNPFARFGGDIDVFGGDLIDPFGGGDFFPAVAAVDGTFQVTLEEGEYQLRSARLPEGYYFKTLTAGSADLLRSPLKISATDTKLRIIAVLTRSSARVNVSGRLRSPAGAPLPAVISLVDMNETTIASPIQPDGTFSVPRVPPGIHAVRLDLASGLHFYAGSVNVAETDRTGLEIAAPPLRQLVGRASLRGDGPLPMFTLIVSSGFDRDVKGLVEANSAFGIAQFSMPEGPDIPWAVALTVAPLPDGTFRFVLPEGAYQVSVALKGIGGMVADSSIQPEYHLDSLTFGAADLLTEPMKVTRDSAELKITLTPPLALSFNVAGRITGLTTVRGPARIELASGSRPPLEAPFNADGAFEFPKVPPGRYFARIAVTPGVTAAVPVLVTDKDVRVSMTIPPPRETRGRVVITSKERREPPSRLKFLLMGKQNQLEVVVELARDGTFRARIPEGDFFINEVIPLTDGPGFEQPLMVVEMNNDMFSVSRTDNPELQIVMTDQLGSVVPGLMPMQGTFPLSGSVAGVSGPGARHVRLEGVASPATHDAPIDDGRFKFAELPAGIYLVSIVQDGKATIATPSAIAIGPSAKAGREIEIRPTDSLARPVEAPTGVIATQMLRASGIPFEMLAAMQFEAEFGLGPQPFGSPFVGSPFGGSPFSTTTSQPEQAAVANLRTINTAEVTFLSTSGGNYGEIPHLVAAGLLDNRFNTSISGYSYLIVAGGGDYVAAAIPADLQNGKNIFFSTPDGVVRFTASKQWAPPGQAGKPVQ